VFSHLFLHIRGGSPPIVFDRIEFTDSQAFPATNTPVLVNKGFTGFFRNTGLGAPFQAGFAKRTFYRMDNGFYRGMLP
jgi:hypothetical protein